MTLAGVTSIAARPDEFDAYNDWMGQRFERYSWGSSDCHSYYRNASGHAPFLFPGNFKEFCQSQDEIGLQAFDQYQGATHATPEDRQVYP
jgi:cyclohexanone monooxygenase